MSTTINELADYLDSEPLAGAAGPLQYTADQEGMQLNFICSYWGWKAFFSYFYYRLQHRWPSPKPVKVPILNTGCLLVRRAAFLKVGMFNPKYFLYGEDPDLGMKYLRYGYGSWILPNVYIIHYREDSIAALPADLRRKIRQQAKVNIIDALIRGWGWIIFDKITANRIFQRDDTLDTPFLF